MNIADELWGPPFIGAICSMSFYGITVAQTIFYYKSFPSDRLFLKSLVAFLFVLDTIHVWCLCRAFWLFFIPGRFDERLLIVTPWTISTSIIVTYVITFTVQTFFGSRVWRVSNGNLIVTSLIAITALVQISAGMAVAIYIIIAGSMGVIFENQAGNFELTSSVVCDITITGSLVYYFRRNRTGTRHTEAVLQKLIRVTVNMGLLGAIAAFVGFILYHVTSGKFGCVGAHFLMSRCYVNSLIATLNARKSIRGLRREDGDDFSLSTFRS